MSLDIAKPWARTASAPARDGAGFFTLTNESAAPDRLIAAASPAAQKIEIHAIKVVGGSIAMRRLDDGLKVPPHTTLTLKPRGYHLLLTGLTQPLAVGARVPVTLTFETAGRRDVELLVEAPGPIGAETLVEK